MEPSTNGIDWPAVVQAASAVAIGVLTFVLVRATTRYVTETRKMADEMRRTNDMSQRDRERTLRLQAPSLRLWQSGEWRNGGEVKVELRAANDGATSAHDVRIQTDHGEAPLIDVVVPGEMEMTALTWSTTDDGSQRVEFKSVTFLDRGGTRWRQRPGELPVLDEG
jgi:hypothetical protein